MKDIKFGVFLPFYALKSEETSSSAIFDHVRDLVLECERLGFDSIWVDDHLMSEKRPVFECWTILSALSSVTTKIRLGTMVLCNSFRDPTLLAKMAATFDVISNGRLEFGIGAGVARDEHISYGIPFLKPSARIERMKEAVEIVKKLWIEEKANYTGKYYRINEAVCEPKPLQKPHPPITIGGGGEKITLKVAAQHANRCDWGYVPNLKLYTHKLDVLESHCKAVGRDFRSIEKMCWLGGQIFIVPNRREKEEKVLQLKPIDVSLKDFNKYNLVASPDEIRHKIRQFAGLGATYFMLFFGELPDKSGLRLFAEKVINVIKTAG
jgi:alkanesulfonate monooxygenase SsuD/methylene tetrahydromethanopterin reductase-like flavin-dependent oxidoreductase (luciferase family)